MAEKRIVGIDIGSYAVKIAYLDPKSSDVTWLGFDHERLDTENADDNAGPEGPPPLPHTAAFEDAPTGVREAPTADVDDTTEAGASDEVRVDDPLDWVPDWMPALGRIAARGALDGTFYAVGIPDGQAVLVEVEVPFTEKSKVQNILPHMMSDRLPLPQHEVTWDFQAFADNSPSNSPARALVGFARNTDVEAVLTQLREHGVDPAHLGVPELQLAAIGTFATREEGVVAFVDIGHELTRVAIVEDQVPLVARTIRSAGRQITDAIQAKFSNTYEEAESIKQQYGAILDDSVEVNAQMKGLNEAIKQGLRPVVRDLRRTFQGVYAKKRVEVARVYICGGTSRIKNIEKYLSAELGLPVRRLSLPHVSADDLAVSGVIALGASLAHHNDVARARNVNLRTGAFAFRGRSSFLRRQLLLAAVAMLVLFGILGVSLLFEKQAREAQRDAMKAAVAEQTASLFGAELTSKSAIQRVIESGASGVNTFIPKMSAYHLMNELSLKMPKDITVTLDRIEVDTDRNLVQLYGSTTDAQAVDRIVSDLEQGIECFKEIKKDKLRVRDEKAEFELHISSGCS